MQALVGLLVAAVLAGLTAWRYERPLKEQVYWFTEVRGHVLTAEQVRALKPKDAFRECTDCPEMIVVPAGSFMMGSPATERGRDDRESPQHEVRFTKPFAVARFDVTFDEWDACAAQGDCDPHINDRGWGRGRQPVIYVNWDDAQQYVAWLSRVTGRPYRLLTEAEWEYAARAGTKTTYYWGDEIGKGNANCAGCGSQWDTKQPAPVGSFAPNAFGLYDMAGNLEQWVQDCSHYDYKGAPRMDRRGSAGIVLTGCFAAVPGSTDQSSSARPTAPGFSSTFGTTSTVSASPERWSLESMTFMFLTRTKGSIETAGVEPCNSTHSTY